MRRARVLILVVATIGAWVPGVAAQDGGPAASPSVPGIPCGTATALRFPIHDPGATLLHRFASIDEATGGHRPAETWVLADAPDHRAVYAAGPGRVLAAGPIEPGDRGGLVVVLHTGSFRLPPSLPDDPYVLPETSTDTLLTVYAGIDPLAVAPGDCVDGSTPIGLTTPACAEGVVGSCSRLPAGLRFEVRLGETVDPGLHSTDWSTVGWPGDQVDGTFPDPQVMVDDGLRDPSRVLTALAAPCPAASPDAASSPDSAEPCGSGLPVASPTPSPSPTPTPRPTARPVVSPASALRKGIPARLRADCQPRNGRLVTGTLAALDCRPGDGPIELVSYFLGRPADTRFTIFSRMREQGVKSGGDCAAGRAGVQRRTPAGVEMCYRDEQGRANLRETVTASCPGVYIGVLGRDGNIGRLSEAWTELTGGTAWLPTGTVEACAGDTGEVSAPPVPTNVHFALRGVREPTAKDPVPPLRVVITWATPVTADTVVEIYGINRCLTKPPKGGSVACVSPSTRIPGDALVLLRTVPAEDGRATWLVPNPEIFGGAAYYDEEHAYLDSVVLRARNSKAASRFAIIPEARGQACDDCVY